ncbi:MAG: DUF3105 domain-containing protein [Solirubrobacteraceae bacterium]
MSKKRGALLVLIGLILAAAGILGLQIYLGERDTAGITSAAGPGKAFPSQGNRHLRPGEPPGVKYNSNPPTSGPHVPEEVKTDAATLNDNQLLQALELGNVVLAYPQRTAPRALRALARDIAGPFDRALVDSGQAVILARRPGLRSITAIYSRHLLPAALPNDPALGDFARYWLDHGPG